MQSMWLQKAQKFAAESAFNIKVVGRYLLVRPRTDAKNTVWSVSEVLTLSVPVLKSETLLPIMWNWMHQ